MIEITQVNASLDEAGDENACLIVGKRVAKRVLRCKDSEIKSIELHRKSIDARKKRDVQFILSFRVELTSPHLEREARTRDRGRWALIPLPRLRRTSRTPCRCRRRMRWPFRCTHPCRSGS